MSNHAAALETGAPSCSRPNDSPLNTSGSKLSSLARPSTGTLMCVRCAAALLSEASVVRRSKGAIGASLHDS